MKSTITFFMKRILLSFIDIALVVYEGMKKVLQLSKNHSKNDVRRFEMPKTINYGKLYIKCLLNPFSFLASPHWLPWEHEQFFPLRQNPFEMKFSQISSSSQYSGGSSGSETVLKGDAILEDAVEVERGPCFKTLSSEVASQLELEAVSQSLKCSLDMILKEKSSLLF